MALMPQVALAATHTLADGKGFNLDLDQFADGDIIVVEAGANAMLMGSKNVTVECGEGVALTLYNVNIDVSAADAMRAQLFRQRQHADAGRREFAEERQA